MQSPLELVGDLDEFAMAGRERLFERVIHAQREEQVGLDFSHDDVDHSSLAGGSNTALHQFPDELLAVSWVGQWRIYAPSDNAAVHAFRPPSTATGRNK